MAPMTLVVLALAGYRLTRLVVLDTILDGPRDWLLRRLATRPHVKAPVRAKLSELLQCVYCVGVWATLAIVAVWHWAPGLRPGVMVIAVIGAQALLSSWE